MQEFEGRRKNREEEDEEGREESRTSRPGAVTPQGPAPQAQPKPRLPAEDKLNSIRSKLSTTFRSILSRLNTVQEIEWRSAEQRIESDYAEWSDYYRSLRKQFEELWDFFAVIEKDAGGWFRVAPNGGPWEFIGASTEGYNFAAGVEKNFRPGAPFPEKYLIVSIGYSTAYPTGIGDERMLGRASALSPELVGLHACTALNPRLREEAARKLKNKITEHPLMFQMSSKKVGQKAATVPVSILKTKSLVDLCQGLFVALNKDLLEDPQTYLPGCTQTAIEWGKRK